MNVTLGGDRIGSGNKEKIWLHHYGRSSHNLSETFKSTAGIGTLYPCLCKQALRGDKFEYEISAGVRTIPTRGAMFGTYKLQIDYYFCPARLYVGILHNNPIDIGLNMHNVMFPTMTIKHNLISGDPNKYRKMPTNTSSLLHYLGLSGLGCAKNNGVYKRTFNAIPVLAYYDIFKNYYSNKQEKLAYVLSRKESGVTNETEITTITYNDEDTYEMQLHGDIQTCLIADLENGLETTETWIISGINLNAEKVNLLIYQSNQQGAEPTFRGTIEELKNQGVLTYAYNSNHSEIGIDFIQYPIYALYFEYVKKTDEFAGDTYIQPFELKNIDDMRAKLLSHHELGTAYQIESLNKYPYLAISRNTDPATEQDNLHTHNLQGLMLKTYQADIFNVWLATEYIDGLNGIAEITKVAVEGGGFKIDALNFSEKMYNLLNRIIVSGNTYEDYQNVVWEDVPKRHLESPMYIGGLSQEIIFEEIVATNANPDQSSDECGLGSIGSRGISRHRKGGKIRFKCDEAGYIIGIMSITPRIDQCQYNEFYLTDVFSVDDLHKPALDQIGFQDLIGERMAYFDTKFNNATQYERHTIGKIPAWLEYMTSFDRTHGDFANENNDFMVLNRNYEFNNELGCIADATTYIDPKKFNNTFMYVNRDSQNFWVQIVQRNITRRKMSAKLIPNI